MRGSILAASIWLYSNLAGWGGGPSPPEAPRSPGHPYPGRPGRQGQVVVLHQPAEVLHLRADMTKSAGTAGVPGEHFGWLGKILDKNFRRFVAL